MAKDVNDQIERLAKKLNSNHKEPENQSAFPTCIEHMETKGMTLLDVFAKEAMSSLIINGDYTLHNIPEFAYDIAEKMLLEREKRGIG